MTVDRDGCVNHNVGHQPHWIQAKLSRGLPGRPGRASAEGDGWVRLELDDGEELRYWPHDSDRLNGLLATGGGRVQLRSHGVLTGPSGSGLLVSVAEQASPCVAPEDVPSDASLVELIGQVGWVHRPRRDRASGLGPRRG